jgi:hypothetical protein
MNKISKRAGAPEFEFEGKFYAFPIETLLDVANSIDAAADALIMPDHCIEAVPLVLAGLRLAGWKVCPPA